MSQNPMLPPEPCRSKMAGCGPGVGGRCASRGMALPPLRNVDMRGEMRRRATRYDRFR